LPAPLPCDSRCGRERRRSSPSSSHGTSSVQFGEGRKWNRRYNDFYGASGQNAWKIARDGLLHAAEWSDEIDNWQAPFINDDSKPLWYRGMLFNELYALTDGERSGDARLAQT